MLSQRTIKRLKELLTVPGVVGYSAEPIKTSTGAPAIRVYLAEAVVIDTMIDGLPVEPLIIGKPEKKARPAGVEVNPKKRVRPLVGGLEIRATGVGTLGYFVVRDGPAVWLLSCHHVLGDTYKMREVFQPTGGLNNLVAKDVFSIDDPEKGIDVGCARLVNDVESVPELNDVGKVNGWVKAARTQKVIKSGSESNVTTGIVDAVDVTFVVDGDTYNHQIAVRSDPPGKPFSVPGDSGSLVVEKGSFKAIGMLMGGTQHMDFLNPISNVLTALKAKLI